MGGLASGDVLCTTMEIERDGLHALKSAFFFGDLVVALGADIRSSDARIFRITTALDQTHLAGPVTRGGAAETSGGLPWVHHDGRGAAYRWTALRLQSARRFRRENGT